MRRLSLVLLILALFLAGCVGFEVERVAPGVYVGRAYFNPAADMISPMMTPTWEIIPTNTPRFVPAVTPGEVESSPTPEPTCTGTVTSVQGVNVRKSYTTNSTIMESWPLGFRFRVVAALPDWWKVVATDGGRAYVWSGAVRVTCK